MKFLLVWCFAVQGMFAAPPAAPIQPTPSELAALVASTHATSLQLREQSLRKTIARADAWPEGIWGDNLWCLSALYLNEKTEEANARLLKQASTLLRSHPADLPATSPENPGKLPWTFFSVTDYVRILALFHAKSPHFRGRLTPETEAAMKQALWLWVKSESKLSDTGADDLLFLLGTENHDLNRRPAYYLITALLAQDPAFQNRTCNDGHSIAAHAAAYTAFYRAWPLRRAQSGLWAEVGSNTYQKYSWPALINLHDLSPDPLIRHRFRLLLDLALIEEAQISVHGQRGGGISRGDYAKNSFAGYKNLLFAVAGQPAGSSHSRVFETSRYQAPIAAVLLAKQTFPYPKSFVISNRVLGKVARPTADESHGQVLDADSSLVNYAYRTPHYLLGSTQLDPTIEYAGISSQKRACGILFDDPESQEMCSVHSLIPHDSGGRPQRSFWTFQHRNMLFLQRIAPTGKDHPGSYNTPAIGIRFQGKALQKVEKDGWIFAGNGKGFVAVKFLDGKYRWDEKRTTASPTPFVAATDHSRMWLIAGDISTGETFASFQHKVLEETKQWTISPDSVKGTFPVTRENIEWSSFDAHQPKAFVSPKINGKAFDLLPSKTYDSPFLAMERNSSRATVTVPGLKPFAIDFSTPAP